ncbi:hypothetical protein HY633_00755 [Candidatus Uhrbacteria bacterium]|nr:hypothetical protein [Candidatus Uhrbacteria bacterium]
MSKTNQKPQMGHKIRLPEAYLLRVIHGIKVLFELPRRARKGTDDRVGAVEFNEADGVIFGRPMLGWVPPVGVERVCDAFIYNFPDANNQPYYKVKLVPTEGMNNFTAGEMRLEEFRTITVKLEEGDRGGCIVRHPNTDAIIPVNRMTWGQILGEEPVPGDRLYRVRINVGKLNRLSITPFKNQLAESSELAVTDEEDEDSPERQFRATHVYNTATGEELHVLELLGLLPAELADRPKAIKHLLATLSIRKVDEAFFSQDIQSKIHPDKKTNPVAKKMAEARFKRVEEARSKLKAFIKRRDAERKAAKDGNRSAPAEQHFADPLKEALFGDPPTLNPETASVEQLEAGLAAAAQAVTPPAQQKAVGLPPPPDTTGMTAEQAEVALQAYAQVVVKATEGATSVEEAVAMVRAVMPPPAPVAEAPAAITSPQEPAPAQEPPAATEPPATPTQPTLDGLTDEEKAKLEAGKDSAAVAKIQRQRAAAKAANKSKGKNEPCRETPPEKPQTFAEKVAAAAKGNSTPAAGEQR